MKYIEIFMGYWFCSLFKLLPNEVVSQDLKEESVWEQFKVTLWVVVMSNYCSDTRSGKGDRRKKAVYD